MNYFKINNVKYDTSFLSINEDKYKEYYDKNLKIIFKSNVNNNNRLFEYFLLINVKPYIKIEEGLELFIQLVNEEKEIRVIHSKIINGELIYKNNFIKDNFLNYKKKKLRNILFSDFVFFDSLKENLEIEIYSNSIENSFMKIEITEEILSNFVFFKNVSIGKKFNYFFIHFLFLFFIAGLLYFKILIAPTFVFKNDNIDFFTLSELKKNIKEYQILKQELEEIKNKEKIVKDIYNNKNFNYNSIDIKEILNSELSSFEVDNNETN